MRSPSRSPLWLHQRLRPDAAIPVHLVTALRRLSWGADPLSSQAPASSGRDLAHPVLADALKDVSIGTWSVGPRTLAYLERTVGLLRPRLVLEFGSGISTLSLAQFLADQASGDGAVGRIISIEQSPDEAARTQKLVTRHQLDSLVDVIVAPLQMREIEGRYVSSYTFDDADVATKLRGGSLDLVVVDGPAAESAARYGTLPLIRKFARPGTVFLLDDALRDGELSVAAGWSKLEYLRVEGIVPVEHGLLRGTFSGAGDQ